MTENTKQEDDGSFEETALTEADAIASIVDEQLREADDGETAEG